MTTSSNCRKPSNQLGRTCGSSKMVMSDICSLFLLPFGYPNIFTTGYGSGIGATLINKKACKIGEMQSVANALMKLLFDGQLVGYRVLQRGDILSGMKGMEGVVVNEFTSVPMVLDDIEQILCKVYLLRVFLTPS